jgi:CRISPR type IV-associated protein Csf2
MRLSGLIKAQTPICITRIGQGDQVLSMTVMKGEYPIRVPVIPGETLKGLLRALAFRCAVDAALRANPNFKMSLDKVYEQAKGGLAFVGGPIELGAEENLRVRNPILSLFGAASPKIIGRLIVEPAIGRLPIGDKASLGMELPEGLRRDPFLADGRLFNVLSKDDRKRWSRQSAFVSLMSSANRKLEDARRALARARKTEGIDLAPFEKAVADATAEVDSLRQDEDYTLAMQRPVPTKNAIVAGTVFDHRMEIRDASLVEVGLFFAALSSWALDPRVGGERTAGYGRIEAEYSIEFLAEGELRRSGRWQPAGTVSIGSGGMILDSSHPIVAEALGAWASAEVDILSSRVVT